MADLSSKIIIPQIESDYKATKSTYMQKHSLAYLLSDGGDVPEIAL